MNEIVVLLFYRENVFVFLKWNLKKNRSLQTLPKALSKGQLPRPNFSCDATRKKIWQSSLTTKMSGGCGGKVCLFLTKGFTKITIFQNAATLKLGGNNKQRKKRTLFPSILDSDWVLTHTHTKDQPNTGIGCFVCYAMRCFALKKSVTYLPK